jgi:hypothetical protein
VVASRIISKPIERWLQREAPEQCATLALVYAGMTESNVAAWTRKQFDAAPVGDFALDLVNAAEDHAQGIGRECRYSLKWLDADGNTVIAMTWRAGEGLNLNLDGTVESQLAQLQRHTESMAKQSAQGMSTLLEHYQEALQAAQLRIKSLEEVRDAFELERLAKVAEAGAPTATEESQIDKLIKTIDGLDRVTTSLQKAKLIGAGKGDPVKPPAKVEPAS